MRCRKEASALIVEKNARSQRMGVGRRGRMEMGWGKTRGKDGEGWEHRRSGISAIGQWCIAGCDLFALLVEFKI